MTTPEAEKALTCHGIRLTASGVMRVGDNRPYSFISRDRVQELVLGCGNQFRRGHYPDVRMRHGRERLPFARSVIEADLQNFASEARARFGYAIHWS